MQDRFQPLSRRRVGEDDVAHRGAVKRARGRDDRVAEFGADRRHGRSAGRGQLVGNGIGVDDGDAARGKAIADRALAAADAAGKADDEAHFGHSNTEASA
jgi:hypothetical protein